MVFNEKLKESLDWHKQNIKGLRKEEPMRETDTHIYFFGDSHIFSNFYPIKFQYKGKEFLSSEQAFMYEKAMTFNDDEIAKQILETTKPYDAKKLGRKVKDYDDKVWNQLRDDIWYNILIEKFSHKYLKELMINSGNKVLVEGSKFDGLYGVKIDYRDDRILDESNWKGKNLLGKILMKVRDDLK